ncbi:hypothetical protein ACI7BZ_12165 [Xanthobacter sp. AM11]|uniref:hypothetical protein n=1 Tax=Xanthobacter sp. AM11 TaxID=3380643 RepID=UPI0039BEEB8A
MAVLLVTYDLNREVVRPNIVKAIKDLGSWAKLSESSYAIDVSDTPQGVFNRLSPLLDGDDNLYVVTLSRPYFGRGPKEVNEWLAARL